MENAEKQRRTPRDEGYLRTACGQRSGDGVAHLSRRVVRDEPHGVDGFDRGACRYDKAFTGQVLFFFGGSRGEEFAHIGGDFRGFGHASLAREPAGQLPFGGFDDPHAVPGQPAQVLLGRGRLEDIPGKVAVTSQMMMEETLKNLSSEVFKKVIGALKNARIIDIYSVENSNAVASDLLTKLLYLGLSCRHFDDYYHQKISAGNLTSQDVAVGISYSGYSRDTVEVMKEAKKSGAVTIVITNFRDSLITKYADLVICTSQQQLFYGDAIFSRTAQMMIVDMIYMGLIVSDYDRFCTVLDKSSRGVRDKAYSSL